MQVYLFGMTDRQFIAFLKRKQGNRTPAEFAAEIGISRTYLHYIYQGERPPGPKVLGHFGFIRATAHIVPGKRK